MRLHLFWIDKNWQEKGCAENYNLVVDFDTKTFYEYTNAFYGYYQNYQIEVKRKAEIKNYVQALEESGFTREER